MVSFVSLVRVQSHQNEVEIFDENLAHISTWLYQTQIHLDEAERLPLPEREKVVKVRQLSNCGRKSIYLSIHQNPVLLHSLFKCSIHHEGVYFLSSCLCQVPALSNLSTAQLPALSGCSQGCSIITFLISYFFFFFSLLRGSTSRFSSHINVPLC